MHVSALRSPGLFGKCDGHHLPTLRSGVRRHAVPVRPSGPLPLRCRGRVSGIGSAGWPRCCPGPIRGDSLRRSLRPFPTRIPPRGWAADRRQWGPHELAFPGLIVPPWIPPLRGDTLPTYAARLAETVPCPKPLVLGGSSFGGMLACEMARHLHARAVILVGSCRSPKSFNRGVRSLRPLLCRIPRWGIRISKPLAPLAVQTFRNLKPEFRRLCVTMFQEAARAPSASCSAMCRDWKRSRLPMACWR